MKDKDKPVVIEQTFEVSIDRLWKALTELKQMRLWFFENIEAFEPNVGFETRFIVENESRVFPHLWRITEVEPGKRITYNWKYEGYAGNSFVTFELSGGDDCSKLTLTHQITESFPQDIPEFRRESCEEGWKWFIKQRLKDYLAANNS
ncbi:SRPBCC family protein [Pleomorphovibrio marinus]|uniref:SRPBCC family protein n=1 Tax=Pleomorphovibrio marinus TaxID=2164132 RepID=UPI000E0A6737|nr:SRPBCC domain-containing protein [Pleomorphovibrio marinus]